MNKNRHLFFWVFTIAVFVVLILPNLVQDGMFMDGMLYACVSKNLSHGMGSFWFPHYSSTLYPFFDQQPPLGFGIQSVFFNLFGDGMYVERLYSFLCALTNAWLITVLWKVFFADKPQLKKLSWFPVLLWVSIPVCFWSFSNNVLENTMSVFDLAAMVFIAKYLVQQQKLYYIFIAGVFIFLATFTKGIQGSFPVAALFLGWLVFRPFSFGKMFWTSLVLLAVPVLIYTLLIQNHDAYISLGTYLDHRVLNSIQNVSEVEHRFYLVERLFMELLPAIVLVGILIIVFYRRTKSTAATFRYKKQALFLLLVGVSASFPLMITLEQRGFYLTTSLPYFAMALCMLALPSLYAFVQGFDPRPVLSKVFAAFSLVLLVGAFVFSFMQLGKTIRDKDMLHDVYLIGKTVPTGTVLGSTRALWKNYSLQEYLVRHFYICQADTILPQHRYLLLTDDQKPANLQAEKIGIPTVKYHLYKRVE